MQAKDKHDDPQL